MITFTTPETRADIVRADIVAFEINHEAKIAQMRFHLYAAGQQFVKTKALIFNNSGTGDFTYDQLLANVAQIAGLAAAIEQGVIDFEVFEGTVT